MSIEAPTHIVTKPVGLDVPDKREYDSEANAQLDRRLVETIEAAENVGNDYLATILSHELGSHYYDTR